MALTFLTPLAALVGVTAIVPLVVLASRERRAQRIRRILALGEPSPRPRLLLAIAVAAVPLVLGVGAAQPVLETTRTRPERTDAEIYVVLDSSRSMLASNGVDAPTRFERAREDAVELRSAFADVPIGLASFTDRVLPHVLPTTDARVFLSALNRSMGIERPPPAFFYATQATSLGALVSIPTRGFFTPSVRKRVLVVLTDGEAREREVPQSLDRAFRRRRVQTVFVQYGDASERIYSTGIAEPAYRPVPGSSAKLDRAAKLVGGHVFTERQLGAVRDEIRRFVGRGPTRRRPREGEKLALMPYVTLAAFLPLLLIVRRRNL